MASRQIIEIDQDKCNGCGSCAAGCHEDALRIIDGKARLMGESLCDGLGACIGDCPLGAIKITTRDAEAYDEHKATVAPAIQNTDFSVRPSARSALSQWPIQLHLANSRSNHFAGVDILLAADCTAFSMGSFHADVLKGRRLLIACPKLDSGRDIYLDKLTTLLCEAKSFSLVIMEVPCCSGLVKLAMEARKYSGRDLPLEVLVIGIDGGFVARRTY